MNGTEHDRRTVGTHPAARRPPFRRRTGLRLLGSALFFGLVSFGGSWLLSPEPLVSPTGTPAVAALAGRDLAVAVYSRTGGRGMFQLALQPTFQTRLSATDVRTGERIWDVQLNDDMTNETRLLAAEQGLVYVAGSDGLHIRSLEDGSAVAEPGTIEGLGDRYLAELHAYDVDRERGLVLTIDGSGEVWQIPFGSSTAQPAGEAIDALWRPALSAGPRSWPTTGHTARVDADTAVTTTPVRPGALDERLVLVSGEHQTPLGDAVFTEPRIVLDGVPGVPELEQELDDDRRHRQAREAGQGTEVNRETDAAAGRESGYIVLVSQGDANGQDHRIETVELETGAVLGAAEIGNSYSVSGARTRDGITVIVAQARNDRGAVVVVAGADGRVACFEIGASNVCGWPR